MARNRYGWQKRAKELARKQKHDDKIKRRQGKALGPEVEEISDPNAPETASPPEIDPLAGPSQPD